jgi:hypothetical protein
MLRNTKVLTTARQKRPSEASTRTLSRPANVGAVTRSQCMNTSASANAIGYTCEYQEKRGVRCAEQGTGSLFSAHE